MERDDRQDARDGPHHPMVKAHQDAPDEGMPGEEISDREAVGKEEGGADDQVEGFQEEAEVDNKGVGNRPLDRGSAVVVPLENGVAGQGEAQEGEGGYGTDSR